MSNIYETALARFLPRLIRNGLARVETVPIAGAANIIELPANSLWECMVADPVAGKFVITQFREDATADPKIPIALPAAGSGINAGIFHSTLPFLIGVPNEALAARFVSLYWTGAGATTLIMQRLLG